jgi:hypothetical protein
MENLLEESNVVSALPSTIIMSAATIYFGAPVSNANTASEEMKAMGLDYLRASPSSIAMTVRLEYKQPGFTLYKENIPAFIKAAKEAKPVSSRSSIYHTLKNHTTVLPTMKHPMIIWSYNNKLSPEQIEQKKTMFGAHETQVRGKFALIGRMANAQWWTDLKADNPVTVTPSNSSNMNMSGFVTYTILNRLADQVLRSNQYPAFKTNDKQDVSKFLISLLEPDSSKDVTTIDGEVLSQI